MSAPTPKQLAEVARHASDMTAPTPEELSAAFATIVAHALDIAETTNDDEAKALAEEIAADARHASARMREGRP